MIGCMVGCNSFDKFTDEGKLIVASLLLVAMPFAPSSFLLLVVRPGTP